MRCSVTAAALLLLLASCGGKSPQPIVPKGEIIALSGAAAGVGSADTVRFGRMQSGEVVVKTLLLHNTSTAPVAVVSYTRTCGCTTFEFDPQPIMPDSLSPARLTFDSGGFTGWQFKMIEVQLAGQETPLKIYIDAEVQ